MIQLKYAAKKIGAMNQTELMVWTKSLLLKISIITGWVLPSNEIVMTVLKDQFLKKLSEDYPSLNVEEIEYAFRQTGTSTKDWGKELNLSMIDEVLMPYELRRRELSRQEEAMQPPPPKKPYDPQEVLNQYRYDIETAFQAIRKGYTPIIHKYFEETLIADGLIKEGVNIHEFLASVVNNPNVKNLYIND